MITFIIFLRENQKLLNQTLNTLKKFDYPVLLISDNNSPYSINSPYKNIVIKRRAAYFERSYVRNSAIALTKTDYITILDGDIVIDENYIKNLHSLLNPGKLLHGLLENSIASVKKKIWTSFRTNNAAFHRNLFSKVKFYEGYKGYGEEDIRFAWEAKLNGYKIVVNNKLLKCKHIEHERDFERNYNDIKNNLKITLKDYPNMMPYRMPDIIKFLGKSKVDNQFISELNYFLVKNKVYIDTDKFLNFAKRIGWIELIKNSERIK